MATIRFQLPIKSIVPPKKWKTGWWVSSFRMFSSLFFHSIFSRVWSGTIRAELISWKAKIWLTSTNTSIRRRPQRDAWYLRGDGPPPVIFPSSKLHTENGLQLDLRTFILFIWGRKWGSGSGLVMASNMCTKSFSHVCAGLFLPADVYLVFWHGLSTTEHEQAIKERVGGGGNVSDHNTGTCPLGELLFYKIKPLLAADMTAEENLLGHLKWTESAGLLQWL